MAGAFGLPIRMGDMSVFASDGIEVTKNQFWGKQGHIAVRTSRVDIAVAELVKRGYKVDIETVTRENGQISAVYLKDQFGGFAIHLLQK